MEIRSEKMELGTLDQEWVELIKEALLMGLTKKEILEFLGSMRKEKIS